MTFNCTLWNLQYFSYFSRLQSITVYQFKALSSNFRHEIQKSIKLLFKIFAKEFFQWF